MPSTDNAAEAPIEFTEPLVDQMARLLKDRLFHSDATRRIPGDLTLVGIDLGQPGSFTGLSDDDLWERVLLPCAANLSGSTARAGVSMMQATWAVQERGGFVSIDVVTEQDPFEIAAAYQRMAAGQVANHAESLRELIRVLGVRTLPLLPEADAYMLEPSIKAAAAGQPFVPIKDAAQAD